MKIAMLLSGGVDSSVAMRLLQEQGHEIDAYYLKIWLQDEFSFLGECPWEEDMEYARGVCEQAGIPLKTLSLQDEYWDSVVTYTIDEIKAGRTPNPDIFCNSLIKFGVFFDKIDNSYDKVATGHYTRVEEENGIYKMLRAPDPVKDQTYFLSYLKQRQVARALFPLGDYLKKDVRAMAKKYELPNQKRKDSQGICFLGQIKFKDFIKFHLGELPGDIVNIDDSTKMGTHDGYYYYTIGQRSGLGLGGGPWYVVKKDIENNIIFISREGAVEEKRRDRFAVTKFNWIRGERPAEGRYQVKIRHGAKLYDCRLEFDTEEQGVVTLDAADQGIAQGQFAVLYEGTECLGGSVIAD